MDSNHKPLGKPRSATSPVSMIEEIGQYRKEKLDQWKQEAKIDTNGTCKEESPIPTIPDGGWGWIIVIASFICNIIVDGVIFSFAIILNRISKDFNQTKAVTAWIGSLQAGFYLIIGPFVSFLSNKYSCRLVTIAGSIIGATGFALSYYAQNVPTLCLTCGVLGGTGLGFIYLPAIVMVGHYFDEKRAFATGLAVCGSGIGSFLMAPLIQFLNYTYGWRATFLILAAIILICSFVALLFKPVEEYMQSLSKENDKLKKVQNMSIGEKFSKISDQKNQSLDKPTDCETNNYLTVEHAFNVTNKKTRTSSNTSFLNNFKPFVGDELASMAGKDAEKTNHNLSNNLGNNLSYNLSQQTIDKPRKNRSVSIHSMSQKRRSSSHRLSASTINFATVGIATSLVSLHSEKTTIQGENETKCVKAESADQKLFDLKLLSSPSFILFCLSGFLTLSGFFIPFIYLQNRALLLGYNENDGAILLSIIGIANTIGRVCCGWLSDHTEIDPLLINNIALIVGGLFTLISPLICKTYATLVLFSIIFGFSIACFAALRSVITVDLVGLENLTNAFGLLLLPQGIATVIGSPFAGWLFDITNSYDFSFYAAGSVIFLSGIMCIPLPLIKDWEKQRSLNKKDLEANKNVKK